MLLLLYKFVVVMQCIKIAAIGSFVFFICFVPPGRLCEKTKPPKI